MKIFGIEGEKLWGEDKKTQDWTFNNYPILELRTPQVTYEIADCLEKNWNNIPNFAAEQQKRPDADVATYGGSLPNQHSKQEVTLPTQEKRCLTLIRPEQWLLCPNTPSRRTGSVIM